MIQFLLVDPDPGNFKGFFLSLHSKVILKVLGLGGVMCSMSVLVRII